MVDLLRDLLVPFEAIAKDIGSGRINGYTEVFVYDCAIGVLGCVTALLRRLSKI